MNFKCWSSLQPTLPIFMTLPKKGSRKIVVDGNNYRWYIRKKPTYNQAIDENNLTAAVELYKNPGSTLLIDFMCPRNDSWLSGGKVEIGPKHISIAVKQAISEGWEPDAAGCKFELQQRIT